MAFACDTDHDRHSIVARSVGFSTNHYLAVCIHYRYRSPDGPVAAVGPRSRAA
jgi:phosphoglucomutase